MPDMGAAVRSRRVFLGLCVVLAWSFVLRVWLSLPDPTSRRFTDERYAIENVRALLVEGSIHPANGFYPGLSYLPQAAVLAGSQALHRLTGKPVFAVFEGRSMTPTGYRVCRFLQAVFGTLSIYLTFRIGRRLFSPGAGLLAAFLVAVVPWHLIQSVTFKPDILLVAATLFAFDRSLAAAEHPDWRRYLAAGCAIGLALASKYNAGPIALPLMIAAFAGGGWRDRRAWGRLVLAGAASIAVFLLLTPFLALDWPLYRRNFAATLRLYERKGAELGGGSHLHTLAYGLRSLASWSFHGPVIGTLGLLGSVLLLVRPRLLGGRMLASYVIGYSLAYSLSTLNPGPHNWLPLAPFLALAAAWLLVGLWERLAPRLPLLRRPAFAGAVLAVLALLLARTVNGYTYRHTVPATHELAARQLRNRIPSLPGRTVIYEHGIEQQVLRGRSGTVLHGVGRLDELPPSQIDLADAVLFESRRLEGEGGDFYRRLAAAGETARFEPAPFRAQGAGLVMVLHPWRPIGEASLLPVVVQGPRMARVEGRLPDAVRPGEVLSLEIHLPPGWKVRTLRHVQVQGEPVEWVTGGQEQRRRRILTRRFRVAGAAAPVAVVLSRPHAGRELYVRFRRWER